jgi:hypothetical protein
MPRHLAHAALRLQPLEISPPSDAPWGRDFGATRLKKSAQGRQIARAKHTKARCDSRGRDAILNPPKSPLRFLCFLLFKSSSNLLSLPVHLQARIRAPAAMKNPPIPSRAVRRSCRKSAPKAMAITTLSLSTGATFDSSPICSARK